ncbi:MAG: hypothetical protein J3K34DRAFT_526874 [Monoraphidium minutum]|nr:MAG: hypothetical protein J3K34DRAFT_526874 [Monoraphidium minutum]
MPQVASGGRGRGRGVVAAAGVASNWGVDASDDSGDEQQHQEGALEDIQGRLFEQYIAACDELSGSDDEAGDAVFAQGLARVAEWVSAGASNSMCLICLGTIKPSEAVWHCSGACYAVLHLPCMQDWARNQMEAAALRVHNATGAAPPRTELEFGCPKCRTGYPSAQAPRAYTCFCGKVADPEWDPWLAPHTCGELCGRRLPGSCSHACRLLCHPGPCPPCPLVVDAACYCGARRQKRRCGQSAFSCGGVCGRRRACGHACEASCHEGECPPCPQVGEFSCECGAERRRAACCERPFNCGRACGKPLGCGRHVCARACHAGPCGGCALEGRRSCPCGKAVYGELRCDQKAPTCGGTCGKQLACRLHACQERCHHGECGKVCRDVVTKPCRCGRTSKQVLCSAEVLCELRCTNMRACGRHQCRRRCCGGGCPPCEETCGRWLRCGNHKCPAPCHSGPCRPCPLTFAVSCACGRTKHTLPCGAESRAAPPACPHPCPVPPICRHAAARHPHRCHHGPCPPCRHACGAALACGHRCAAPRCHDRQAAPVADWQQPKPPKNVQQTAAAAAGSNSSKRRAEAAAAAAAPPEPAARVAAAAAAALAAAGGGAGALTPCPPCNEPVTLPCLGGHCAATAPCHQAAHGSCGGACGQPLACGHHSCSLECHVLDREALSLAAAAPAPRGGPGAPPGFSAAAAAAAAAALPQLAAPCERCARPCGAKRPGCAHACPRGCHPGPCPDCEVPRTAPCFCGKTTLSFTCHELQRVTIAAAGDAGAAAALSCGKPCHRALPGCQHPCRAPCHAGACGGGCQEEVTVRCECRRLKQKWGCGRVRAALQQSTGSGDYDAGATSLKLLPCDAGCAAGKKAAQQGPQRAGSPSDDGGRNGGGGAPGSRASSGALPPAAAPNAPAGGGAAKPSAKRMSRAERDAAAAGRVAAQLAEERRRKLLRHAGAAAAVLAAVAAAAWLVRLLYALLAPPEAGGPGYGGGGQEL